MSRNSKYVSKLEKVASSKYNNKVKKTNIENTWKKDQFVIWYVNHPRICCYCGLLEYEGAHFNELQPSKRNTRGKTLEVERYDNSQEYSKNNCTLCCHWCNNAKSDIFTPEQFKKIAPKFVEVIRMTIYGDIYSSILNSIKLNYPHLTDKEANDTSQVIMREKDPTLGKVERGDELISAIESFFKDNTRLIEPLRTKISAEIAERMLLNDIK